MVAHYITRPISRRMIGRWFTQAGKLASVPHVKGRGAYGAAVGRGGRRAEESGVEEATKTAFGWSSLEQVATYDEEQPDWAMEGASCAEDQEG